MPYATNADLPDAFDGLPDHAKSIAREVINSVLDSGQEESVAFASAWAAVKKQYVQREDGTWAKRVEATRAPVPSVAGAAVRGGRVLFYNDSDVLGEGQIGSSDTPEPHTHRAVINGYGYGVTSFDAGHFHPIDGWRVSVVRNHSHGLDPGVFVFGEASAAESPSALHSFRVIRARRGELFELARAAADELSRVEYLGRTWVQGPEVQLFRAGKLWRHGEEMDLGVEMLEQMRDNLLASPREVAFDFSHASTEIGAGAAAEAAGVLRKDSIRVSEDGMFAVPLWREDVAKDIRAGKWLYLSPTFHEDAEDPYAGGTRGPMLFAVALTNVPYQEGLAPIACATGDPAGMQRAKETRMDAELAKVLRSLSLPAGADVAAAVVKLVEERRSATKLTADLALSVGLAADAKPEDLVARVKALSSASADSAAKVTELSTRLESIETERRREKAALAAEAAIRAGKVLPAQREPMLKLAFERPDDFAAIVAATPQLVSLDGLPAPELHSGEPAGRGADPETAAEQAIVAAVEAIMVSKKLGYEQAREELALTADGRKLIDDYARITVRRSTGRARA